MTTSHVRFEGTVEMFDAAAGLGQVVDSLGQSWPFHCLEIADGTRSIAVGERVTFAVEFRTLRREATNLVPL